ncbi:Tautomerase/MIF superfamily [Morchella snyderi]|nr:Tautomerase/MIF superfamily [Morchella snyderi]
MATLSPVQPSSIMPSAKNAGYERREPPSPAPTDMSFGAGDDRDKLESQKPQNMRDIGRDTPAAPGLFKKSSKSDFGRKRSMKGAGYYGEVFAVRETGPVVPTSAGVWVELKTNVILENEFEFAKSLSEMIAKRYGRTEETVCVSIDHSACMVMGGTFDGSYMLTITSLSMISPTCNKRNAALISEWINNNLGVVGARGYIRFVDPDFANYATGGTTMLDLMEREELTRTGAAEKAGIIREKSVKRSMSRHRSKKERTSYERSLPDPMQRDDDALSDLPSTRDSNEPRPTTAGGRMRKRSMFNLFSKSRAV